MNEATPDDLTPPEIGRTFCASPQETATGFSSPETQGAQRPSTDARRFFFGRNRTGAKKASQLRRAVRGSRKARRSLCRSANRASSVTPFSSGVAVTYSHKDRTMNATARTLPMFNARDLLDEVSTLLRALRDLTAPADTLGSVSRSDLSCLYDFARRLPATFPNLAAHAPDVSRLIGELLEPCADLGGVSRAALFSTLDALTVAQHCAVDALRMEDEDSAHNAKQARARPAHLRVVPDAAPLAPFNVEAFAQRVGAVIAKAAPRPDDR